MTGDIRTGLLPEAERAYASGNLVRAEKWCRLQLSAHPNDRDCKVLLALVLAKTRREEEAVPLLREVLRDGPSYEAHITLSTILFFQGDAEGALEHGEAAIGLAPTEPATYNKIGHELVRLGRFADAVTYFRRATAFGPDVIESNQNLASALKDAGRPREALEIWTRLNEIAPDNPTAWLNRGTLELAAQDFQAAVDAGMRVLALEPKSVDGLLLVSFALQEMGKGQEAEVHLRRALTIDPKHAMAQASLGLVLQEKGRFEEGVRFMESSLREWETNGLAHYIIARSKKVTESDRLNIAKIERLLHSPNLRLLDRSYMEYALGKSFEDLGDYEQSMRHFDRGNEIAREFWFSEKPWNAEAYCANIQATIEVFSQDAIDDLSKAGLQDDAPVLIVGMIRSGTTLVEQIVSSHPEVAGAGELTYWHEMSGQFFNAKAGAVDRQKLLDAARGYVELLRKVDPLAKRVSDKLPHNYALLGPIHAALPNARIIHIRRNPLDNCLSVYTTAYQRPPGFTLVRENIVSAYSEYRRIAQHWRETLPPDRLLEIDYEDLVANRERVTRQMIAFIGLEWSDACLAHEKNSRSVHTPSAWQVRQPIYKTSIERWRHFEPWIAPFDQLVD